MLPFSFNNYNNDREFKKKLGKLGFQIIDDLAPLYRMVYNYDQYPKLSKNARNRLKWMDHFRTCQNVAHTCRHFGISRKVFYKWKNVFDPMNLFTLEDRSRAPKNVRQPEITQEEEDRIIQLRKRNLCYSKFKLEHLYMNEYGYWISSWKIQRVIQKYKLYPNPARTVKITRKRLRAKKKERITKLQKKPRSGFLLCLDTVQIRRDRLKRYIFTGIDFFSKVAFARMYKNANSQNAADFLNRLLYLINGNIENIQTDNGSEFHKYFERTCDQLNLPHYWSRARTPKDNPVNERFNETIQYEFIKFGNFTPDIEKFNHNVTEWLIEYNFRRPHETLNYATPINFHNSVQVLPMYPSRTRG
jgi:transposase InsO family protein